MADESSSESVLAAIHVGTVDHAAVEEQAVALLHDGRDRLRSWRQRGFVIAPLLLAQAWHFHLADHRQVFVARHQHHAAVLLVDVVEGQPGRHAGARLNQQEHVVLMEVLPTGSGRLEVDHRLNRVRLRAGKRREMALGAGAPGKPSIAKGLTFCVLGGLGSGLVNLGLVFGASILKAAEAHGASRVSTPNAAFLPLMLAGGIPSLIYCSYLILKNKNAHQFGAAQTAHHWFLTALMALLWFASTILYGAATTNLGQLGTVFGWPLFMSVIVITAAAWGLITGEWKGSGSKPRIVMAVGVGILVVAIFVLSFAGRQV